MIELFGVHAENSWKGEFVCRTMYEEQCYGLLPRFSFVNEREEVVLPWFRAGAHLLLPAALRLTNNNFLSYCGRLAKTTIERCGIV